MTFKSISLSALGVFILVLMSGCGATYHLRKSKEHELKAIALGAIVRPDTVYKEIKVLVPEIRFDTLVQKVNFKDTIFVTNDSIITKVKVDVVRHTVFVQSKAPTRTITIKQPIAVTRTIKAGKSIWELIQAFIAGVAIGVMGYALLKAIRKK